MPTGYTATLHDGDQAFEDFVLDCARAFGALVTLRDEPDAPIPDEFKPSSYHVTAVAEADQRLKWVLEAHDGALLREQAERIREATEYRDRYLAEREARLDRYGKMLARVEAWRPPTKEHMGLRKFMVEQLTESIRYDCGSRYQPPVPPVLTASQYREQEAAKARKDVEYHSEELRKERERAEGRTAWVRSLRESLR